MFTDDYGNRRFPGLYRGLVSDNRDPLEKGRLKLQVPQVFGDAVTDWAWAERNPGAPEVTPEVGTGVWVQFEGGDPSYPVWVGTFVSTALNVGPTGASSSIAIGTVTATGPTGTPTVTNSGTSTAAVFDFVLQQGPTGPAGSTGIAAVNSPLSLSGPTGASLYLNVGATGGVQAWDADLDAIASLTGPTGALKKTAANTWVLDTAATSSTGVSTTTTNFNNNLSSADDTVQKALDTIDNLSLIPRGGVQMYAGTGATSSTGSTTGYGTNGIGVNATSTVYPWLLCNGDAVSRTVYSALFTAIGTTYGAGDSSTTFNLPNMTSKFPRGATAPSTGGGSDSHTHTLSDSAWAQVRRANNRIVTREVTADAWTADSEVTGTGATSSQASSAGAALDGVTDGPNTIPVAYTAFRFIIKT